MTILFDIACKIKHRTDQKLSIYNIIYGVSSRDTQETIFVLDDCNNNDINWIVCLP